MSYEIQEEHFIEIPFEKEKPDIDSSLEDGIIKDEPFDVAEKEHEQSYSQENFSENEIFNERLDRKTFFEEFYCEILNFDLPETISEIIDKIVIIIKHQLYIFDSITRLDNYNNPLSQIWRNQMNTLGITDRYQLYGRLKQLKQMMNELKQFSQSANNLFELQNSENIIFRQTEEMIDKLQIDIISLQTNDDIDFEIKNLLTIQTSYCFHQSFRLTKQNKLMKFILLFILRLIDFDSFRQKLFDCKACKLKDKQITVVLNHILNNHLLFLRFFNSTLGRCLDIKCRNNNNSKNYNAYFHTMKFHSAFYKLEKPLRILFNEKSQFEFYQNQNHLKRNYNRDINYTISTMPINIKQNIESVIKSSEQYGQKKFSILKSILMCNIEKLQCYIKLEDLQIFDEVSILIKMSWLKFLLENKGNNNYNILNLPQNLHFFQTLQNVISLEFQVEVLKLIFQKNEIISLYNRLLIGYYNNILTQNQFDIFLKELRQFINEFAFFNIILNNRLDKFDKSCIFNGVLCDIEFQTTKQCFDHYFFHHKGIIFCLCRMECTSFNLFGEKLDQIYFHCHDYHKATFKNFISDYLKEQKLYYSFKATCCICKILIKKYSDAYWMKIEEDIQHNLVNFNLECLEWADLLYSYQQNQFVKNNAIKDLQLQYEKYTKQTLSTNEKEIAFNEKKQVAICRSCKQKKQNKIRYLNKAQFENKDVKQILPLARLCANISTKCSKIEKFSYPHLIGNIYAQSKKALLFVEGTDIVYSINMNCAKVREKFKLMGSNKLERENVISMCLNHHFLSNHCYQMANISRFIIRQQEQLIVLNKQIWRRHLEQNNIKNVNDKMQLEFQKLQDLILFDDILHRNQIHFIYQNFNIENSVFMVDFIEKLKEFFFIYSMQKKNRNNHIIQNHINQFVNLNNDDQQFWKLTLWLYLYCEQLNEKIIDSINEPLVESLIEYLLDNEILQLFIRRYSIIYVQRLLNNKIHPLYIGIMYQIKFQQFMLKYQKLTGNQQNIINIIFHVLCQQAIITCNFSDPNLKLDEEINIDCWFQKQEIYRKKFRWFELELLKKLNSTQFIDMNCRVKLIKYAFDQCEQNQDVEEIIQSDINWTVKSAQTFLNCLKELKDHLIKQDKQIIKQHLQQLEQLQEEIAIFQNNFIPIHKTNSDQLLDNVYQQNNNEVSKFKWIKKIYIVYFIPVEIKFQNMLKVHHTLRKILDVEPFYSMNKYYNVSSFQKEIEYAIFPNLYPKAEGGLITRAPNPRNMQLIIDIEQAEKNSAINYSKDIGQIRQQNQEQLQQVTKDDINNNVIYLNLELYDFTTKQRQGELKHAPKQAIFNIQDETALNNNLSFAYVYKWQYLSIYHYEKARLINIDSKWPQIVDLRLRVKNDFLIQSVVEKHVTNRLDDYLSKNQQQWDNEQQQYIKKLKKQTDNLKKQNKSKTEIESFIMEQEKMFLRNKIQKIIQNSNLKQIAQQMKDIDRLELNSESSVIESEEDNNTKKNEQFIQKVQNQLRQQLNSNIFDNKIAKEQENVDFHQMDKKNQYMQFTQYQQNLSDDTKFKLNCSFTRQFQKSVYWIFWRFYEWMKQKFYCYQFIVNNEKGTILQNSQQIYYSIPPIQGTETYFSEQYNKLKTYCFNEGLPLFFVTITMNEFDEKTFKCMRGLNFLDLEDEQNMVQLNKRNIRYEDIIQNANNLVDYYIYLLKIFKKVIKNKFRNQLNPYKEYDSYKNGIFGDYKSLVTRVEFQVRGSLHFHLLIFVKQELNNQYKERFIQYLLGEFSLYNTKCEKDIRFLRKFDLYHHCSVQRCITKDNKQCRLGFPKKITNGQYIYFDDKIEVYQRRQLLEENVITFQRDIIKFFNSNCQINICNDENVLSYLTKYINKATKLNRNIVGKDSASKQGVQELGEKKDSIMQHVKKFLDQRETSLQEAYFAFKQIPIIEQSFRVIKIKQQPMSIQISNKEDNLNFITQQNIKEMFEINQISISWFYYTLKMENYFFCQLVQSTVFEITVYCISRPDEFEYLNFYEYSMNTIQYGKKKKYLIKMKQEQEPEKEQYSLLDQRYFMDQNSNIVKIKQKLKQNNVLVQTSYLHPSRDYKGPNNVYYLQMLQLYWPHRKYSWIQTTHDNFEGYQKAYNNLVNNYDYPDEDSVQNEFRKKYCKFQQLPLKQYVEQYNNLQPFQIKILENLYKSNFSLNNFNQNFKSYIKVDYILELINQIEHLLDQEKEYYRTGEIELVIQYLNPKKVIDRLCELQINEAIDSIKRDVQIYWDQLSQISKSIIINLGLICNEYGSSELLELCPQSVEKYFPTKIGKGKQSIVKNENINQNVILSQVQDDLNSQDPCNYRNAITVLEYVEGKVRNYIKWDEVILSNQIMFLWEKLKNQQRLTVIFMLLNLILNFPQQNDRKISESTFIHGPGGVGKTHLILFLIQFSTECKLNYNILCPTQQAVQNLKIVCRQQEVNYQINAQTIHSFFQLKHDQKITNLWVQFEQYLKFIGISQFENTNQIYQHIIKFKFQNRNIIEKQLRDLDLVIIEEVSMIDPYFISLLDIYSQISRKSATQFGGIQVFIFGDSYQLQPVQEKQIYYFYSHIFKSNYFMYMIELTEPIRQESDLNFYNNILKPFRKGQFHEDEQNFKTQIELLKKRVVQINSIGPKPKIRQELDQKHSKKEQVICLFFTNENVELENYKRAKKILDQYNEDLLSKNNFLVPFRKFIHQPIQFSFNQEQLNEELLILQLGENQKFKEEFIQQSQNYNKYYLMLPIGIRNFIAKQLGLQSHKFAQKSKQFNKSNAQLEITLFKNAEIVIRKNIDKKRSLINGQFAKISDMHFDIDFQSIKSMGKFIINKNDYIKENNLYDIIQDVQQSSNFKFSKQVMQEIKEFGQNRKINNVNYVMEKDISQEEKFNLYQKEIQPRLQQLQLLIENVGIQELKLYDKKLIHQINITKQELIFEIQLVVDQLEMTIQQFNVCKFKPKKQQDEMLYRFLKNNNLIKLYYIDIINERFGISYLLNTVQNLKLLIREMPDYLIVYIHQIPINLGYARTIHTSQGSTLQNVIIDLDMTEQNQHGLLYTALSRVKNLESLFFQGKFDQDKFKVKVNTEIHKFCQDHFIFASQYLEDQYLNTLINGQFKSIWQNIIINGGSIRKCLIDIKARVQKQ